MNHWGTGFIYIGTTYRTGVVFSAGSGKQGIVLIPQSSGIPLPLITGNFNLQGTIACFV